MPFIRRGEKEEMKKILVLLLLLVLLGFGAIFVSGNMARDSYMDALRDYSQGPLTFANIRYERGLFVSKAATRVVLADPKKAEGEEFALIMEHIFRHGPLPLETGEELRPALAQVETFLASAADQPEIFRKILVEAPALEQIRAKAWIGLLGAVDGVMQMPAVAVSDAESGISFEMEASSVHFLHDRQKGTLTGNLNFPGLRVQDEHGKSGLSGLSCTFDMQEGLPWVYVGNSTLKLAHLEVAREEKPSVTLSGLHMTSESGIKFSRLFNVQNATLDSLMVGEKTYGPFFMDMAVRNLDAQAMSDLNKRLRDMSEQKEITAEAAQQMGAFAQDFFTKMLAAGPEFQIPRLSLHTDEGNVEGHLDIRLEGSAAHIVMTPHWLLQRLEARGEISAQNSLVRHIVARSLGGGMSEEENATLIDQAYDAQLGPLLRENFIVNDGERIKSRVVLNQGRLTVNGKAIPLS